MKKVGFSILFAIVIALVVWIASLILSFSFLEWSFFIGLGLSVLTYFFNSSGGLMSKGATFQASMTGFKIQNDDEMKANVGTIFYGSLIFTVTSFIVMVMTYF